MSLHQTSFCFICSHLTSGEKEGDELRRNSDVMEILKKTRFPRVHGSGDANSPRTILEHEYGYRCPVYTYIYYQFIFILSKILNCLMQPNNLVGGSEL